MQPQAYSYVRFSSKRQERGDSLRRQLQIALDWYRREIAPLGLPLSDLKADDGFSAYKGAHVSKGSLGHFRAEIGKSIGPGSILIAENLDRISRQGPKIARELIASIVDIGVDIHVASIGVKLTPGWENDPARSHLVDAELGRAWKESVYKSDRGSATWQNKKAKAVNGLAITRAAPAWLTVEKVGTKPIVLEKRAATVRRIFALAGLGMGAKRIVRRLVADGIPSFDNGKTKGKAWSPEYVQKVLGNRAVIGEYQPHKLVDGKRVPVGEAICDYYPAVVSFEAWQTARAFVEAKNRNLRASGKPGTGGGRVSVNSIFNPLVRDETNGGVVMVYHCKAGDKPYLTSKWTEGKKAHRIRYDKFEAAFLHFLADLDWQAIAGESESEEEKAARAELNETVLPELDRTARLVAKLTELAQDPDTVELALRQLKAAEARQVDYTSRRDILAAAVASARSRAAALHSPEELLDALRSGSPELRLKLKAEIAKRIRAIELSFEEDDFETVADVKFINGAIRGILFKGDEVFLVRGEGQI
jgi:hypothetical protein